MAAGSPDDTCHLPPRQEAAPCGTGFLIAAERGTEQVGPAAWGSGGRLTWPPAARNGGGTPLALFSLLDYKAGSEQAAM